MKTAVTGKTASKIATKDLYKQTALDLEKNTAKMNAIKEAGKTPSGLTKRVQQSLIDEKKGLLKQYAGEKVISGLKGGAKSSAYTVFGFKDGKSLFKEGLSRTLPIYQKDGEETAMDYYDSYFTDLYGRVTTAVCN